MNVTVLLAHPDRASFNHAIARAATERLTTGGHAVALHDLYLDRFDPAMSRLEVREHRSEDPQVERHCEELRAADALLIVHPVWFDHPPAMLKGWVDRVLRQGVAFEFGPHGFRGLLELKRALVVNTANRPPDDASHDPCAGFWRRALEPCGVPQVEHLLLQPVVGSSDAQREAWLREVAERVGEVFPS